MVATRIARERYERALLSREAECERKVREQVTPTPTIPYRRGDSTDGARTWRGASLA